MLPHGYQLSAELLLVLGGTLACFAGYRLFKIVLAIYGFILGAMLASSVMGVTNTIGMIVAAVLGGIAGSLILVFAYFIGIALIGAGLGAMIAHVVWASIGTGDPPAIALIVLAIFGALAAMFLQRYVIIVTTAFGGAWTLIVGGLAIAADRGLVGKGAAASGDVWILYPATPLPNQRWVVVGWIVLGLIGTVVQLSLTGRKR